MSDPKKPFFDETDIDRITQSAEDQEEQRIFEEMAKTPTGEIQLVQKGIAEASKPIIESEAREALKETYSEHPEFQKYIKMALGITSIKEFDQLSDRECQQALIKFKKAALKTLLERFNTKLD